MPPGDFDSSEWVVLRLRVKHRFDVERYTMYTMLYTQIVCFENVMWTKIQPI